MGLRKKIITVLIVALLLIISIVFVGSHLLLGNSFSTLEQDEVNREVQRAIYAINYEIEHLDTILHDWSSWDDSYNFITSKDEEYIQNNLMDATFANLNINQVILLSNDFDIIYNKAFNLNDNIEIMPPSTTIIEQITGNIALRQKIESNDGIKGIMVLPDSEMIVAIRPILNSYDGGPIIGWFIMGRLLDKALINNISEIAMLPISILTLDSPDVTAEIRSKLIHQGEDAPVIAYTINNNQIYGFGLLYDLQDSPGMLLRVELPRNIYLQGQTTIYTYILVSLIFAGLLLIIVVILIDKFVISKIINLSKRITELGLSSNPASRLPVSGKDEFASLAQEINATLGKLEKSQEELTKSQKLYSTLVEHSNDGIVIIDKGILKFANQKMTDITSYTIEELVGKRFTELISSEYKEFVADDFQRRVTGNHLPDKYETTMLAKNGEKLYVEISLNTIELDKKPVVIAIIRDITMRKLVQEQLITTDRLSSIGELAAGVAHELSNPLTSVMGYTQLILERDVPEALRKDLEIVNSEARRAADVTKNLLMFARRYAPEKQLINVNELLERVLEIRNYEQKINNIKVVKELETNINHVAGDPSQLQQVFINIIINAEYAMIKAHRGGTLKVRTRNSQNNVVISFNDDGTGISSKDLPKIFDPFFTTKDVVRGSGLGLSICHGIITRHNGKIYVESEHEKGANFIIELPVANVKL